MERKTPIVTYPTPTQEAAAVYVSPTLSPAQVQEVKTLIQKTDVFSGTSGRVDKLLEKIGQVLYITTLHLAKGYCQTHLTPRAK
jgi:hypothetical protein